MKFRADHRSYWQMLAVKKNIFFYKGSPWQLNHGLLEGYKIQFILAAQLAECLGKEQCTQKVMREKVHMITTLEIFSKTKEVFKQNVCYVNII